VPGIEVERFPDRVWVAVADKDGVIFPGGDVGILGFLFGFARPGSGFLDLGLGFEARQLVFGRLLLFLPDLLPLQPGQRQEGDQSPDQGQE
jgi:hypothetical protein